MSTIYNHEIPFWNGTTYDNTTHPYTVASDIGLSITTTSFDKDNDFMKRLVESYLEEHYHGITLDEVLELIRKHQPERLL
jgi:thymidine kinase